MIGLDLTSAASGSTIKGLAVTDFAGGGVLLNGAANVTITVDDIGLVNSALAPSPWQFRVRRRARDGANHDTLTNDVISGNNADGVVLTGSGTKSNTVEGSFIGTDPSGMHSLPKPGASMSPAGRPATPSVGRRPPPRPHFRKCLDRGRAQRLGTSGNVVEGD